MIEINTNLGELSEPLTKLIEVTSKAIGTIYAPTNTVRQAKAEAKAKIIHAHADNEVADIQKRTDSRIMHIEKLHQKNIEEIVSQAAKELPDTVSDLPLSDDWILQFFDQAQNVCEEDMRKLWARILAGEIASPGSFSKRTLTFLKDFEKVEAEKFSEFCRFSFTFHTGWNFVFEEEHFHQTLKEVLGKGDFINHFISIGLVSSEVKTFSAENLETMEISYFDEKYKINNLNAKSESIPLWCTTRSFTSIGQQLSKIANVEPYKNFQNEIFNMKIFKEELHVSFTKI